MQINLITGVDGSGKSTIFSKLKQLNFSGIAFFLAPKLDEKNIDNQIIKNLAISINLLGDDAHVKKSTSLKAMNLFASMMIFSDVCESVKLRNSMLFCERHPLIDAQIYAKFYAPLLQSDLLLDNDIDYIDNNYISLLDFILTKIPNEYLVTQSSKSRIIFAFIYDYFAIKKTPFIEFYINIFKVDLPDKIYFLDGDATVFYHRIISRNFIEPHEKVDVLQMLISAYSQLLNSIKNVSIVRINANEFSALEVFYLKLVNEISCSLSNSLESFPNMPGRGLVTQESTEMRQMFLENINNPIQNIKNTSLFLNEVKNKIESYVGSVEIPLGIVGPLLYYEDSESEMVYALGGTLEGALIASMNRGAKAISLSGGFRAHFVHQKMVRAPMFQFQNLQQAVSFDSWIKTKFIELKKICENYSNHAKLIEVKPLIISRSVHLNFVFETGDASGQNMTTTCTWHAMLWIVKNFESEKNTKIKNYVIEGNCSSDKKASCYSVQNGRGVHVIAECYLTEIVIERVLRTTSDAIFNNYLPSVAATRFYGMPSYNINVANAIAAIFVATGQDLACIHESSNAFLSLEKTEDGLYLSLTLPSLVIATIGGGTNLPRQQEALALMKCNGRDKIQRFAMLIAGFALGLEISTYSAIVSGAFAKAHEKLGRNKPINWITKSELSTVFFKNIINANINSYDISTISLEEKSIENGIITTLAGTVNSKLIGFFTLLINFSNSDKTLKVILKSKAVDTDVIKGLHKMAAQINPELSDLIYKYRHFLEYDQCHIKEIQMYMVLSKLDFKCIPTFYGSYENVARETFLIIQEFLDKDEMFLMDSENKSHLWTRELIENAIIAISKIHNIIDVNDADLHSVPLFDVNAAQKLYEKLLFIVNTENDGLLSTDQFKDLQNFNNDLNKYDAIADLPVVIIHNDFNPRNVAVRKDESICIYDWELAVRNVPHRDIVEFLAFTLPDDFSDTTLKQYLNLHYRNYRSTVGWELWEQGYVFAIKEFILTRANFYCSANIVLKLKFYRRIIVNALKMLSYLENKQ